MEVVFLNLKTFSPARAMIVESFRNKSFEFLKENCALPAEFRK